MNSKLLLLASTTLMFLSTASYANTLDDANKHSHTIAESLTEIKDSLKDTAKIGLEKFSDKALDIYNRLSAQIDEMFTKSKDKKDAMIESLKQERAELKKELENYDNTVSTKTEEMRHNLVKKLEELNDKITNYNNESLKK